MTQIDYTVFEGLDVKALDIEALDIEALDDDGLEDCSSCGRIDCVCSLGLLAEFL